MGRTSGRSAAAKLIRDLFETDCEVFFVFNGTAANSLALASCCQSYHSILCHELAHVETDECGAPEFFSNGTKVLLLPGTDGKIDPAGIERTVKKRTDLHFPKPRAVSLTNATEVGTTYTPAELKAIWAKTKSLGLKLHMDEGAVCECHRESGLLPQGDHVAGRGGCAVFRAGRNKGWRWVKPWSSSTGRWRRSLSGAANRRGSFPVRCGF
jgi:threonine aldolase